jgi:hypothetical protein
VNGYQQTLLELVTEEDIMITTTKRQPPLKWSQNQAEKWQLVLQFKSAILLLLLEEGKDSNIFVPTTNF